MISTELEAKAAASGEVLESAREIPSVREAPESPVEYDGPALVELTLDDVDYRLDVGRAGTALCISMRPSGTWSWAFRGEARWENRRLRARAFGRDVLDPLSSALAAVIDET